MQSCWCKILTSAANQMHVLFHIWRFPEIGNYFGVPPFMETPNSVDANSQPASNPRGQPTWPKKGCKSLNIRTLLNGLDFSRLGLFWGITSTEAHAPFPACFQWKAQVLFPELSFRPPTSRPKWSSGFDLGDQAAVLIFAPLNQGSFMRDFMGYNY